MTGFSDSFGDSAEYTYYSDGLRSSRKVGSTTYKYYYNGDKVVNETKNGSNFATNVYGVDGPISRQYSGLEHYYYKNVHGDVIFAFTSNHWRSSEYSYAAYGEEDTSYDYYSSNPNPLRYSGEYLDSESGMTYLRARYYDPYQRRFISEDPAKDGLNWYAYCGNNPVMFVDPSGMVAYERFDSLDEAVKDWAWNYYGTSHYVRFETASIIYEGIDENGIKFYSYTYSVWGSPHSVLPLEAEKYMPKNATINSFIHTHPNTTDGFSRQDYDFAINQAVPVYVVDGNIDSARILKYGDTRNGYQETEIVNDLSVMQLSEDRKKYLIDKFQSRWKYHVIPYPSCGCSIYSLWPNE